MGSSRHLIAFNRSVRACGIDQDDLLRPLVLVGRDLARDLDFSDQSAAGIARLMAYRSVLKQLGLLCPAGSQSKFTRQGQPHEPVTKRPETTSKRSAADQQLHTGLMSLADFRAAHRPLER